MRMIVALFITLLAADAMAQPTTGRPLLGVATTDLPPNTPLRGAWVHEVRPGSAASDAGVQPNDVVVAVDGQSVETASALTAAVGAHPPGSKVTLQILRPRPNGTDQLKLTAVLGGVPAAEPAPRLAENPASGAVDTGQWVGFTDPAEQAFSTEVPQGWRVEGGTVRHSSISAVPFLRLLSPDRRTYLIVGDPGITFSTTPSRFQIAQGVREGQSAGGGITIRRYRSGTEFARDYVLQVIPSVCANVAVTGEKPRPDLARGPWAQTNPNAQHAAGEVSFTCTHAGTAAIGKMAASSYIYRTDEVYGGSFWAVEFLAGFIAAPDSAELATAELAHIGTAWRMNPAWVSSQQAAIEQYSRGLVANAQRTWQLGQQQLAHARQQMHVMDQQFESFDRVITGSSPYADAAGNTYQLDNTRTQWIGPNGQVRGTTGASPGPAWQQLQEVPPQ
jgi:hypothetical protein